MLRRVFLCSRMRTVIGCTVCTAALQLVAWYPARSARRPMIATCSSALERRQMHAVPNFIHSQQRQQNHMTTTRLSKTPHCFTEIFYSHVTLLSVLYMSNAVCTCIAGHGHRSWTGPLGRNYLPGFPYMWSLRKLRQKINSIYCTVIC